MPEFRLVSPFKPTGDQPQAIDQLTRWLREGHKHQTLLGATGTGKTFTMAAVVERLQRPTLVISPNKTLAAQLYAEFREFFPTTPSSTSSPTTITTSLRPISPVPIPTSPRTPTSTRRSTSCATPPPARCSLAATCIIVASVSCIYGLGEPEEYYEFVLTSQAGRDAHNASSACCASWWTCNTSATTTTSLAAASACAATASPSSRLRGACRARRILGGRGGAHPADRPAHRRGARRSWRRSTSTPPSISSPPRTSWRRPSRTSRELEERVE
jgi:hypothetical protein